MKNRFSTSANRRNTTNNRRTYQQLKRTHSSLSTTGRKLFFIALALALVITGILWLKSYNWDLEKAWNQSTAPDQYASGQVISGFSKADPKTSSTARAVLDSLPVKERSAFSPYERSAYGQAWADVDSNGCDTRNDILARDLTNITVDQRCRVTSGVLIDPYTTEKIEFTRGEKSSQDVPIDHVVALSNAWSTGASTLDAQTLARLANDPLNLQATSNYANTQKSDADAARWLPQTDYRCEYVARQVSVKSAYGLWVTQDEKKAIEKVLKSCPDQPAYRSHLAP